MYIPSDIQASKYDDIQHLKVHTITKHPTHHNPAHTNTKHNTTIQPSGKLQPSNSNEPPTNHQPLATNPMQKKWASDMLPGMPMRYCVQLLLLS